MDSNTMIIGMDLGDRWSELHLTLGGEAVGRCRVGMAEPELRRYFSGTAPARVVLEASTASPWVSRLLEQCGHEVRVVNPRHLALVSGSMKKTDRGDAAVLAMLGYLPASQLHTVRHRSEQAQADLAVVRARAVCVKARTALINSCRGMTKSAGGRLPRLDASSFSMERVGSAIPEVLRSALTPLVEQVEQLSERIREYEEEIEVIATRYPETRLLRRIDSVGLLTSLTYVLTIDDPYRFRSSRAVGAFLGLVPRLDQSGKVNKQLGITHAGDSALRSLLVECAQRIVGGLGKDCRLQRWALARIEEGNRRQKRRVVVAVARKLAVLMHRLWVTGEVYDPFHGLTPEEVAMTA